MSITIYTITHKKFTPPSNAIYHPLHVGRALSNDLGYQGDDTGDNISEKNKYYSELTGLYWIWKNDKTSDVLGLCHYRRFFVNEKQQLLTQEEYEKILSKYDVMIAKPEIAETTYYEIYKEAHHILDLNKTAEVIAEICPEYCTDFEEVIHGNRIYVGNLFAAPENLFFAYAKWLFSIFFELEKRIDVESYDDYHKRVFGFLSEELLMVWIKHNNLTYFECRIGCTQEKAETAELKEALRELVAREAFTEAKELFYETLQKRPDVILKNSDLSDELETMIDIILTCEQERELEMPVMTQLSHDLDDLVKHWGVLKRMLHHLLQGGISEEEISYLIDCNASWADITMIIINDADLKPQSLKLFNQIAMLFYEKKEYDRVLPYLQQALKVKESDCETLENIAKVTETDKKVLILEYDSFGMPDAIAAWQKLGYGMVTFSHEDIFAHKSAAFDAYFSSVVEGRIFDFVFSLNYYPIVAANCEKHQIKYIAIVYDCPQIALYSYTVLSPYNYIFLFDKTWYLELKKEQIDTIYYLPLPVAVSRMEQMRTEKLGNDLRSSFLTDVSFVGSLYNEEHNLYNRLGGISDYARGFLESAMQSQMKVYGYNFLQEVLKKEIVDEMYQACPFEPAPDSAATREYIYANYFLGRKTTELERIQLLTAVSNQFSLALYTHNATPDIPKAKNKGPIDYYEVMPYVFKESKINLNITLRSIRSGIPLRALDIMGAGGFLLTNYQEDFLDYFVPEEDFVFFISEADMMEKISYYLTHEAERLKIAENGHRKVKEFHNYEYRLREIINIVNTKA